MRKSLVASSLLCSALVGCGDDIEAPRGNQGGTAGSSGSGGSAGSSAGGSAGAGGSAAGGSAAGGSAAGGSAAGGSSAGTASGGSAAGGAAGSATCELGYADCDSSVAGCETATDSDPEHCGGCLPCGTENVEARSCESGACVIACAAGFEDCNGDHSDGCEVDLQNDPDACGSCATLCGSDGVASRSCTAGQCTPTCASGRADCNADGVDGCEITLDTDPAHCGACQRACSATNASAVACSSGSCAPTCAASFGDCSTPSNPAADNGCETDLRSPSNCGACGHSCQGGGCDATNLSCLPVTLVTSANVGGQAITDFALDSTTAYFVTMPTSGATGTVRKVSLNATGLQTLASGLAQPRGVRADGTYVYYSGGEWESTYVRRVPLGGGTASTLYSGSASRGLWHIERVGTNLFWQDNMNSNVYRMGVGGGTPVQLNTNSRFTGWNDVIDTDGVAVFVGGSGIGVVPAAGGPAVELPASGGVKAVAVDAQHVYFTGNSGLIRRVPRSGGAVEDVMVGGLGFALDGNYIYVATASSVHRAPKGAGVTATPIWSGTGSGTTTRARIQGGAIYWAGAQLMKLALP